MKTLLECIVVWPAAPGLMYATDRLLTETLFIQQENHTNVKAAAIYHLGHCVGGTSPSQKSNHIYKL